MSKIEYEGKIYQYDWLGIILLFILAPTISLFIYFGGEWLNGYVWLHEITAKLTVWSLNFLTGLDNQVLWVSSPEMLGYSPYSNFTPGWFIIIVGREQGPIRFETFCTGIQAIAIFIGVIIAIPHSLNQETNRDIWPRKIKAMIVCSLLFYLVNIIRMWIQLYLYHIGYAWNDIHYSISAASSFIAIAAILVMHKYVPEFVMSLMWIGDQVRVYIQKRKLETVGENPSQEIEKEQAKYDDPQITEISPENPSINEMNSDRTPID